MSPDRTAADAHLAEVEAEQAALRRIAALLARSVPAEEVFDAVVDEVRRLMRVEGAALGRYEADKTVTVLALSAEAGAQVALPVDKKMRRSFPSFGIPPHEGRRNEPYRERHLCAARRLRGCRHRRPRR